MPLLYLFCKLENQGLGRGEANCQSQDRESQNPNTGSTHEELNEFLPQFVC